MIRKFSQEIFEWMRADYVCGDRFGEIAKRYGVSQSRTAKILKDHHQDRGGKADIRRALTECQEKEIVSVYSSTAATATTLGQRFNCSEATVRATLGRHGIPIRRRGTFVRTDKQTQRMAAVAKENWAKNRAKMLEQLKASSPLGRLDILEVRLTSWARRILVAVITERDKACVKCASASKLHVHHIKPLREYQDLAMDFDNCELLCNSCHMREEILRKRASDKGIAYQYVSLRGKP